jgi:PDZ domain-containing protein
VVGILVDQDAEIELPIDVDIDLGRVGGPSAGLPFALEIARKLGRDVTHGCRIAATGALALDGTVIPIGGVKQKTIGARRADVDFFLVPAGENAEDARDSADGLRIIPVESFQQALRRLATSRIKC